MNFLRFLQKDIYIIILFKVHIEIFHIIFLLLYRCMNMYRVDIEIY